MRAHGIARLEFEMRRADGSRLWTDQTVTALRDVAGQEVGWVLVVHDVTEERDLRERLRRANALHEAVFSAVPALALIVDRDLRILRANRAFTHHVGRPEDALVGRPLGHALHLHPENESALREVLQTGLAYQSTGEPDPAGQRIWDWGAVPVRDADGHVGGILLTAVDTTERRDATKGFFHLPAAT